MQNLITLGKRHPRLLVYFVSIEVIYILYEFSLRPGASDGSGLALGLLLTAATFPSSLLVGWLQPPLIGWLGFSPGDTHAFSPRCITWQISIFLNIFVSMFYSRRKHSLKSRES
jgi:hypothetical protein